MKKENRGMTAILAIYSFLMLCIMGITVFLLAKRTATVTVDEPETEPTQEQYIYVYAEPNDETTVADEEKPIWVVREHEKKVGIFSRDGVLLELLEVYTNTLPKADQKILREGITVTSRSDLYALIEDYSE